MAEPSKLESEMKMKAKKALQFAKDPVERMKLRFLERGGGGVNSLTRWVRIMDDDGNRRLKLNEFIDGMRKLGIKDLSEPEMTQVFETLDKSGDGELNIKEFLSAMQPPMSKARLRLVKSAFEAADTSGNGVLTIEDLKHTYDFTRHPKYIAGQMTGKQCLTEFLQTFTGEKEPDGTVTWEEFLAYYSGISCCIDHDAYFDLMMRQAWKFP